VSRRTITAVSLLFLAVACSNPDQGDRGGAAAPRIPKATAEARGIVLPFDEYVLSLKEHYTVSTASDLLVEKCMRKRGHDWKRIDRPSDATEVKNRRRYGVIEPAVAKSFGYHAPDEMMNPYDVPKREAARESKLPADAKAAALSSADGCVLKAEERLSGGREPDYDKLSEFDARIFEESKKTPEVDRAMKSWRTCMRKQGFGYDEPDEAVRDSRWWSDKSAGATPREKATASADVRCKKQARLVRLRYSAEKKLEKAHIKANPAFYRELTSAKKENLRHARSVISRR